MLRHEKYDVADEICYSISVVRIKGRESVTIYFEVESGCPYFLNNNRIICIFTGSVFVIQPNRSYLHVGKIRS